MCRCAASVRVPPSPPVRVSPGRSGFPAPARALRVRAVSPGGLGSRLALSGPSPSPPGLPQAPRWTRPPGPEPALPASVARLRSRRPGRARVSATDCPRPGSEVLSQRVRAGNLEKGAREGTPRREGGGGQSPPPPPPPPPPRQAPHPPPLRQCDSVPFPMSWPSARPGVASSRCPPGGPARRPGPAARRSRLSRGCRGGVRRLRGLRQRPRSSGRAARGNSPRRSETAGPGLQSGRRAIGRRGGGPVRRRQIGLYMYNIYKSFVIMIVGRRGQASRCPARRREGWGAYVCACVRACE